MGNIQNKDIEFLNSYWKNLNNICSKFDKELRLKPSGKAIGSGKMRVINYSDLGQKWDVGIHINGASKGLEVLRKKLIYMILKGDSVNIKPMIEAILSERIKTFKFKDKYEKTHNCGKGHFRFGTVSITLENEEIKMLKQYFNYKE